MATTTDSPLLPVGLNTPRLSTWNRALIATKKWWQNLCEKSEVTQLLCCVDATEADNYRRDTRVRSEIREAMRSQMGFYGQPTCIAAVMHETKQEHNYALGAEQEDVIRMTAAQWDALFVQYRFHANTPSAQILAVAKKVVAPARVVPKFAAAVTLHIKAKLGVLAKTEANLLLVQRKYLEVCRDHRVRDVDVVSHMQFVQNAYFTEDVLERLAKTRLRAPAWLRLFEEKERTATLEVC